MLLQLNPNQQFSNEKTLSLGGAAAQQNSMSIFVVKKTAPTIIVRQ